MCEGTRSRKLQTKTTNEMTIKEIYSNLTRSQQLLLKTKIMADGVSYATAYAYCRLQRRPKQLYQQRIALYVKSITGLAVGPEELFPEAEA